MNKAREFDQSVLAELKTLLGDRVSTSAAVREHHGKDESYFPYALPDAVIYVKSTEEVRDAVNICRRHRVPMIPYGVGTSLEGHILAVNGGVCIDLSQMNQVLTVHEADLDAVVQAGGTRKQLNEHVKQPGLFFPVDPGAGPTLGGMAATPACGANPVIQTIQSGIPIARCDIVCEKTVGAINKFKKTSYRVAPTVFFEFHGSKSSVVEQAEAVQAIAKEHGGKDFVWATKPEERTQLWQARHDAYFACLQLRPGSRAVSTDVSVPISRLAECVGETMADVKNYFAPVPLLGHIGDGNFHLMLMVDPARPEETEIAKAFNKRLVERALKMEGTCTGEHGIGMGKIGSMRLELGDDVIDVMRDIKKVFDPDNLMNPGKVVPLQ